MYNKRITEWQWKSIFKHTYFFFHISSFEINKKILKSRQLELYSKRDIYSYLNFYDSTNTNAFLISFALSYNGDKGDIHFKILRQIITIRQLSVHIYNSDLFISALSYRTIIYDFEYIFGSCLFNSEKVFKFGRYHDLRIPWEEI